MQQSMKLIIKQLFLFNNSLFEEIIRSKNKHYFKLRGNIFVYRIKVYCKERQTKSLPVWPLAVI